MDPFDNPFSPGAGISPPELAGRAEIIRTAETSYMRVLRRKAPRPLMLLGLRGTGKTVLLNKCREMGVTNGLPVSLIESPEAVSLASLLFPEMRKILTKLSISEKAKLLAEQGLGALRSFAAAFDITVGGVGVKIAEQPGMADSGDIQADLPELFELIGRAAAADGTAWVLLVDEIQYLSAEDLSGLIVALHKSAQAKLPIVFVGAGLPQTARLAGDAKSYAERMFVFFDVGPLHADDAAAAIRVPLKQEGADIEGTALDFMIDLSKGYPFFLQEWGAHLWDTAQISPFTIDDAQYAYNSALSQLDHGFFKVRVDRLSASETRFVEAMAALGDGPYSMNDIAKRLGKAVQALSTTRQKIIQKGMIYSVQYGSLDFTVPLFSEYIRRTKTTT
ncbi:MAG: ATP-binding protein [Alphaproteobacteria bacterium]